MVVNWNVGGGREIRTDGHHLLTPLQVTRSTTSALFHNSVQARTKEWSTGWRRTLWHAFLSSFQQEQHLRSDAPTTSPRDLTLKMAAHQTSSSEKGKTSQRRLVFGFMVKCRDRRSAGRLGKGHALYCRHLLSFPSRGVETLRLCCAHQTRQAANHTHWMCLRDLQGLLPRGCAFWDETYHGWWDDAVEGRVHCGDYFAKKSRRSTDIILQNASTRH